MKSFRYTLLLAVLFFGALPLSGQKHAHIPGQILIGLNPEDNPGPVLRRYQLSHTTAAGISVRRVADLLNTWLLQTDASGASEREVLAWLSRQPEVRFAQFNHILEERFCTPDITPDDPLFIQQWQHINTGTGGGTFNADLDSDLAWNTTTGGLTPRGDSIVVAIIDGGIQDTHQDLQANMWRNNLEIPGDGMDNDGNGYTDDYRGWNVFSANDNVSGQATGHGTPVSSIIGAKGNNGIGVAGVNWDVKMMFVAGNSDEATILTAYDYVLKARKRYNATNGQQGAFVVAVNCSWGITYGQPSEAPLWCAAFDTLGAAGILSIAATANEALDIDVVGDLPTACPSDFLVSVTSLTKTDLKSPSAAWGATTIDLGAYGEYVFTAGTGNTYSDSYKGTSFAAPQVCGAIGLLYSAPCSNLTDMAKANPAAAALWAKSLLLGSTIPNGSLENKTVTGGRLNLNTLVQGYQNQCVSCMAPFSIAAPAVGSAQAQVVWTKVADVQSVNLRWRKIGNPTWTLEPMVTAPFILSGLSPCTDYEVQLRSACGGSSISSWSAPSVFRTDGCCSPPAGIAATGISENGAQLSWAKVLADSGGYLVRLQPGSGAWQEYQANENTLLVDGLSSCTEYHVSIKTLCGNENSTWSPDFVFRTGGCGACLEQAYCASDGGFAFDEWIAGVEIGSWGNFSGGATGFQDFTASSLNNKLVILPGSTLPVTLTPGYSGLPYKEHFRIYIDYNADGDFDDPDELAFDPSFASDAQVKGEIIAPNFTASGFTRMRIQMKFIGPQGTPPLPCETFDYGQVEDYCAHLGLMMIGTNEIAPVKSLEIYPQPAGQQVYLQVPDHDHPAPARLTAWSAAGQLIREQKLTLDPYPIELNLDGWPTGLYLIRLEAKAAVYQQKLLKIR